jgi:UDP:flavonoid glycosyltransferase YjiC (YdhE family)
MRVLFTTQPGVGHFHPLVPLIQALTGAGHDVAVACAPSFASTVEASGVQALPAGFDWLIGGAMEESFPGVKGIPPGPERVAWMITNVFAGVTAERMATDVMTLAATWPFDLVVRETLEFGGYLAAERMDLPHAVVQTVIDRPGVAPILAPCINRQRTRLGLSADNELATLRRYLHLSSRPPSLHTGPFASTNHSYRAPIFDRSLADSAPEWADAPMASPVVFASLGTVVNPAIQGVFKSLLEGLSPVAGTLVLAVSPSVDPSAFGPQPAHIHVERYVPQSLVFPRCDLVVTHAGSGTLIAALAHGLPMVLIPLAADQPHNAAAAAARGLGRIVGPEERTADAIETAARDVLEDPTYRRNARQVRDEMAALPPLEYAVELLERLASERAPIIAFP